MTSNSESEPSAELCRWLARWSADSAHVWYLRLDGENSERAQLETAMDILIACGTALKGWPECIVLMSFFEGRTLLEFHTQGTITHEFKPEPSTLDGAMALAFSVMRHIDLGGVRP